MIKMNWKTTEQKANTACESTDCYRLLEGFWQNIRKDSQVHMLSDLVTPLLGIRSKKIISHMCKFMCKYIQHSL